MAEMFISFLLLFALFATIIKIVSNYFIPLGYDNKNVWVLFIDPGSGSNSDNDSTVRHELFNLLIKETKTLPEVVSLTKNAYNIPYMPIHRSDIKYKDKVCRNAMYVVTDNAYPEVMNIKMREGRWFENNDLGKKETPIVINSALKEILFGDEPALDKVIQSGLYKVTGIVEHFKIGGEFSENRPAFFIMMKPEENPWQLLIKSTPEAGESFRSQLTRRTSALAKDWSITTRKLSDYRKDTFKVNWMPVIIISAISGFLIINILLGLMGLLWYTISHRKSEIGLRKSVGAPAKKIIQQFTFEMLILATLGILPGIIIAVQFPILKAFGVKPHIYMLAILAAIILIYLLVMLCSFLPAVQAAKIQPAEALHEE